MTINEAFNSIAELHKDAGREFARKYFLFMSNLSVDAPESVWEEASTAAIEAMKRGAQSSATRFGYEDDQSLIDALLKIQIDAFSDEFDRINCSFVCQESRPS